MARLAHDERRSEILAAAETLFSGRQYGAVSMESVAQAAGVTRGLLHHYFGNKEGLYIEVVRQMFRTGPLPVPEYVEGATREDRVAESVDRWLDMVEDNQQTWFAALGIGWSGNDVAVGEFLDRVRERAVDSVIEVLGAGPAADAAPELRAVLRSYGGLAEASTREWLESGRLSRPQVHALLTHALLALVEVVLPQVKAQR